MCLQSRLCCSRLGTYQLMFTVLDTGNVVAVTASSNVIIMNCGVSCNASPPGMLIDGQLQSGSAQGPQEYDLCTGCLLNLTGAS
jgi:hypothetical protein